MFVYSQMLLAAEETPLVFPDLDQLDQRPHRHIITRGVTPGSPPREKDKRKKRVHMDGQALFIAI